METPKSIYETIDSLPPPNSSFWEPVISTKTKNEINEIKKSTKILYDIDIEYIKDIEKKYMNIYPEYIHEAFRCNDSFTEVCMDPIFIDTDDMNELSSTSNTHKEPLLDDIPYDFSNTLLRTGFNPIEARANNQCFSNFTQISPYSFYVCHLVYIIGTTVWHPDTKHLFTSHERILAKKIISLSSNAAGLLARIVTRVGPWFRTNSFLKYHEVIPLQPLDEKDTSTLIFSTMEEKTIKSVGWPFCSFSENEKKRRSIRIVDGTEIQMERVQTCVKELIKEGLLFSFPLQADLNAENTRNVTFTNNTSSVSPVLLVMEAISKIFDSSELKALVRILNIRVQTGTNPSNENGGSFMKKISRDITSSTTKTPNKSFTNADAINAIINTYKTQKTLLGRIPIANAALQALTEIASPSLPNTNKTTTQKINVNHHFVVRIVPTVISFIRKCHALFYLATATAHLSSGGGTGCWPVPLAETVFDRISFLSKADEKYNGSNLQEIESSTFPSKTSSKIIEINLDESFVDTVPEKEKETITISKLLVDTIWKKIHMFPVANCNQNEINSALLSFENDVRIIANTATDASDICKKVLVAISADNISSINKLWVPTGSGSKYADVATSTDSFLANSKSSTDNRNFKRNAGIASSTGNNHAFAGGVSAINNGAFNSSSGLNSPAMQHVFRLLSFANIQGAGGIPIFKSIDALRIFEAAHLCRSQVEKKTIFSIPVAMSKKFVTFNIFQTSMQKKIQTKMEEDVVVLLSSDEDLNLDNDMLHQDHVSSGSNDFDVEKHNKNEAKEYYFRPMNAIEPLILSSYSNNELDFHDHPSISDINLKSYQNLPSPPIISGMQIFLYAPLLLGVVSLEKWEKIVLTPWIQAVRMNTSNYYQLIIILKGILELSLNTVSSAVSTIGTTVTTEKASESSISETEIASRIWSNSCDEADIGAAPLLILCVTIIPRLLTLLDKTISNISHNHIVTKILASMSLPIKTFKQQSQISALLERIRSRAIGIVAFSSSPLLATYRISLCLALTRLSGLEGKRSRHHVLRQVTAGSIFTALLWESLDPLERGRSYPHTLPFLHQLVTNPYTPHRSGRWWTRFCLNASHMGLHADAFAIVKAGNTSIRVTGGDKLTLLLKEQRLKTLLDRKINIHTSMIENKKKNGKRQRIATDVSELENITKKVYTSIDTIANSFASRIYAAGHEDLYINFSTTIASTHRLLISNDIKILPYDRDITSYAIIYASAKKAEDNSLCAISNIFKGTSKEVKSYRSLWVSRITSLLNASQNVQKNRDCMTVDTNENISITHCKIPLPYDLRVDSFVRSPLSRTAGIKSNFMIDHDPENDSYDIIPNNVQELVETISDEKNALTIGNKILLQVDCTTPKHTGQSNKIALDEFTLDCFSNEDTFPLMPPASNVKNERIKDIQLILPSNFYNESTINEETKIMVEEKIDTSLIMMENITDSICAKFGWFYPNVHNPGKYDYNEVIAKLKVTDSLNIDKSNKDSSISILAHDAATIENEINVDDDAVELNMTELNNENTNVNATPQNVINELVTKDHHLLNDEKFQPNQYNKYQKRREKMIDHEANIAGIHQSTPITLSVEHLALAWYYSHDSPLPSQPEYFSNSSCGWRGMHAEGGPIYSLVALVTWDILFASGIPNTFLTPYQDSPLDLDAPNQEFYRARTQLMIDRVSFLASASNATLISFIGHLWRKHFNQACRGLNWNAYPLQLLQLLAIGIGGHALACLVDALATNHKQLTSGMPDLILWRVLIPTAYAKNATWTWLHIEYNNTQDNIIDWPDLEIPENALVQVRMVEVKGPRDKLSEKQHTWLRILLAAGIATSVVKIVEPFTEKQITHQKVKKERALKKLSKDTNENVETEPVMKKQKRTNATTEEISDIIVTATDNNKLKKKANTRKRRSTKKKKGDDVSDDDIDTAYADT